MALGRLNDRAVQKVLFWTAPFYFLLRLPPCICIASPNRVICRGASWAITTRVGLMATSEPVGAVEIVTRRSVPSEKMLRFSRRLGFLERALPGAVMPQALATLTNSAGRGKPLTRE